MPRLIYADEAKENACKYECGGDPSCPYSKSNGVTHEQCEFMRAIDECRTIDAAPVVRCRDCKHKDVLPDLYGIGNEALYCPVIEHYVERDFFCKYGEKVTE